MFTKILCSREERSNETMEMRDVAFPLIQSHWKCTVQYLGMNIVITRHVYVESVTCAVYENIDKCTFVTSFLTTKDVPLLYVKLTVFCSEKWP